MHKRLPEVFCEERHHGGEHAKGLHERVPQRPERDLIATPEPPPGAPDVPVREVIDERLRGSRHLDGEPTFVPGGCLLDELLRPLHEPTVESLKLGLGAMLEILEPR